MTAGVVRNVAGWISRPAGGNYSQVYSETREKLIFIDARRSFGILIEAHFVDGGMTLVRCKLVCALHHLSTLPHRGASACRLHHQHHHEPRGARDAARLLAFV